MQKKIRAFTAAGLVAAVVALAIVAQTDTASVTAERGTRADGDGYTQLAWGAVSTQRSGR